MLHLLVINIAKGWLDHYNIKRFEKVKIDTPPWYVIVGGHPRIRLAMVCESKGWEECQIINVKMHIINACFNKKSEPLTTCLVWKIT